VKKIRIKSISILLVILVCLAQFICIIPTSAGSAGTLISTIKLKPNNESGNGYTVTNVTVDDNENFTIARELVITSRENYNNNKKDIYFGEDSTANIQIGDWLSNDDAEIRFWAKASVDVSNINLSIMAHSSTSGYPHLTYNLSLSAGDKWQEIRIKRSEFSKDTRFDDIIESGSGTVYLRLMSKEDLLGTSDGASFAMSNVEFYNGAIAGDIDPDGGTIDTSPKPSTSEKTMSKPSGEYNKPSYTLSGATLVEDNTNFTTARVLKVSDTEEFNKQSGEINLYEDSSSVLQEWVTHPYAEMRLWVKTSGELKIKFNLLTNVSGVGYRAIFADTITIPASDKWQEIRIKRESFNNQLDFISQVSNGVGTVWFRFTLIDDMLAEDETALISAPRFNNGYIVEALDPEGGTIDTTPKPSTAENTMSTASGNYNQASYKVTSTVADDNTNFTTARQLEILDAEAFNALSGNVNLYEGSSALLKDWITTSYAEMRLWVKTSSELKIQFNMVTYVSDSGYKAIWGKNLTIPASDKWQEIRIKREDFSDEATFISQVSSGEGTVHFRFTIMDDILAEGETAFISAPRFNNGYIDSAVDPNGGTIVIVPSDGEKVAETKNSTWGATGRGYLITETAVADNSNFETAAKLTVYDRELYLEEERSPIVQNISSDLSGLAKWAGMSYNELRFWAKTDREVSFRLLLLHNSSTTGYKFIETNVTIPASDKWQEIRIARKDFSGYADWNSLLTTGTLYFQIKTEKNTTSFLNTDESLLISPVEFYDGTIPGDIDPAGGTIIIPDIYGKLIQKFNAKVVNDNIPGITQLGVSVTDNDFFSNAIKLTMTDTETFYKEDRHIYVAETPNAKTTDITGWYNYQKAEIRFWVKTPHKMEFDVEIVGRDGGKYPYISTTVKVGASDEWQLVKIPRSAFNTNKEFTGSKTQFIRICAKKGSDEKDFLSFCESVYISTVEVYNGIIPASADVADKGNAGKVIYDIELSGSGKNGTSNKVVEIDSNKNFNSAVEIQITNARTFDNASSEKSHYIHNHNGVINLADWFANSNAQMRFWVKTEKDLTLQLLLVDEPSKKPSSNQAAYSGSLIIKGSDNWQEVRISSQNFRQSERFDPACVKYIKINGSNDTTITTNEVFYAARLQVYDGYIATAVDSTGGTTKKSNDNAIIATFSSFNANLTSGENITAEQIAVDTNKYFVKSLRILATAASSYRLNLKTYYDTYDISRANGGTLRLWIKSDNSVKFNVIFTDKSGKEITIPFSADGNENWQELRINLSDIKANGFDFSKLLYVSLSGQIKAGEQFQIGKMELWKQKLTTKIESSGGTIDPPRVIPPAWDSLTTYTGDSRKFASTKLSDFWINDWNVKTRDRSIQAVNVGLDKSDPNYYRFTTYKKITMLNPDVYYSDPTYASFGFSGDKIDMTPYLKTGTLRFWVKAPKNMTIQVMLKSRDDEYGYSEAVVAVPLKKSVNDEWSEIHIPLKDFYDATMASTGKKWDPSSVVTVYLSGVDMGNPTTFLDKNEELMISMFEFWSREALEPEPYDPTRIFYSMHGEIFVKDTNEILPNTSRFNAYRDTLSTEQYKKIVSKYFKNAKLLENYLIELIQADTYNYKISTAYDKVLVYIPLGDTPTENLVVAVYNKTGIYVCDTYIEDEYIVVSTDQFGQFLLLDGGKRNDVKFDYNSDMSEIFGLMTNSTSNETDIEKQAGNKALLVLWIAVGFVFVLFVIGIIILMKKRIIFRKDRI